MENVRYMISDAANIVNVESHVLRYWEEELELQIPRNEMGHRYYTEENIAQFQKIKEWKEQGYQLKAIRMMIHNIPEEEVYTGNSMNGAGTGSMVNTSGTGNMMNPGGTGSMMSAGNMPSSQVIQINREYPGMQQQAYVKEHNNSASNTVKLEQFRTMMMGIVKQAVEENNQSLGKEVSLQVGDKVLKEMNYLMREQDEAEEERFRKLDAAIRTQQKGHRFRKEKVDKKEKKEAKMLKKEEKLKPNLTV